MPIRYAKIRHGRKVSARPLWHAGRYGRDNIEPTNANPGGTSGATITPTGVAAGDGEGSPQFDYAITATGVGAGDGTGSPQLDHSITLAGVAAGGGEGSPVVTSGATIVATGADEDSGEGSPQLNHEITITGAADDGGEGSPALASAGMITLSGVAADDGEGSPTVTDDVAEVTAVLEQYGRKISTDSAERFYLVTGHGGDAVAAFADLLANSDATYGGMPRSDTTVEEIPGPLGYFTGTVTYAASETNAAGAGDTLFTFDTSGGTQHLTQSKGTTSYAAPTKTAADFNSAIGVTESGVQGVDVPVPAFSFTLIRHFAAGDISQAQLDAIYAASETVNTAEITIEVESGISITYAIGELVFHNASGGKKENGEWEIAFNFSGAPNKTGLAFGDVVGVDKKAWQYIWLTYKDVEDAAADPKRMVKAPLAVYVEDVFDGYNHNTLPLS